MKLKYHFLFIAFLIIFTSCKKNKSETLIVGTWLRTQQSTEYNGQTYDTPISGVNTITYESCSGNDEWCPAQNVYDGNTNNIEYQISDDGDILYSRNIGASQQQTLNILELTESDLQLSTSQQGSTTVITYVKQ